MNNMSESSRKKIIILIASISFVIGMIFMLILNKLSIYTFKQFKESYIYEKTSLNKAISKAYDATVVVNTDNNNGTGFVYKKDNEYAYIITNEHVIRNANDIEVVLTNNKKEKAEILGKDEYIDIAVLRIRKTYVEKVVKIGNSKKSYIGDTVFVIGCPYGENFSGTVTSGIISGKDRLVKTSTNDYEDYNWVMNFIQIDASINPGNSGGPLLNINGEVIGIITLKIVENDIEGMSFATPIEEVKKYIDILENKQVIKRPSINIDIANINDTELLNKNDISPYQERKTGVVVLNSKDTLNKGDIIIKVNDVEVIDIPHFKYEIFKNKINSKVTITYLRNKTEYKTSILLKE